MTELILSLPEPVKRFVDAEAAAKGFASSGDYVQELILRAFREKTGQELDKTLLRRVEAIDRGEVAEMTPEEWDEIRADVEQFYHEREAG